MDHVCIHGKRMNTYRNGRLVRGEKCVDCYKLSLEKPKWEICSHCGSVVPSDQMPRLGTIPMSRRM